VVGLSALRSRVSAVPPFAADPGLSRPQSRAFGRRIADPRSVGTGWRRDRHAQPRPRRQQHHAATSTTPAGQAHGPKARNDRPFYRRRPRRSRPDHGARAAADRALPGLPVCWLAGTARYPRCRTDRLGASGATLAIHLSIANLARVVRVLTPAYGPDCPAVVAYRVSWPDELLIRGTLGDIRDQVKEARITRTALVLVGRVFAGGSAPESRLYAADHYHSMRPPQRA